MAKVHDWKETSEVGRTAAVLALDFLNSPIASEKLFHSKALYSVEENRHYQKREIDFLCIVAVDSQLDRMSIEVKGDRREETGNFFLETVSDISRNTRGAFLVSDADWYFYCFVNSETLYCLPTALTRKWFLENQSRFRECDVNSQREGRRWQTRGRIVPIRTLLRGVDCIPCFRRVSGYWNELPGTKARQSRE